MIVACNWPKRKCKQFHTTFFLQKEICFMFYVIYCIIVLTGNTGCNPDALDPELMSALQNVSEVVCRFVDNNPTAWAPLICQVQ